MAVHILDAMAREGFEDVIALHDRRSGLRGFLGLHDTSAGPAFGGIRRFSYRNENSALLDCLRLSRWRKPYPYRTRSGQNRASSSRLVPG